MTAPSIALVLLTFNEAPSLERMLPRLSDPEALGVDEMFAMDGGSTDGTLELFAGAGVRAFVQREPGRGAAMREAPEHTKADCLVFFSPDGNEDPADIARFRPLFAQGWDLVIASRMMAGAVNEEDHQLLRPRKWANNIFNLAANLLFRRSGPYVTDSINGFRGLRRELFRDLALDAPGYTIEYQMTMRAMHRGLRIAEFPTAEGQRLAGETKALAVPTGLRFLQCLWREWRRRDTAG